MNASIEGKRPRGRPKSRWIDRINKDAIELRADKWKEIAQYMERCSRLIKGTKDLHGL
ncbi:unnamed protein product [Nezara viridula]|uniref:Uncharacterized protein n=1 Tax=Nezara viridula TaxID=85310 RepID=A0A9P0HA30_NEZVI|nr:unnamed protein product [Nezara viridula]